MKKAKLFGSLTLLSGVALTLAACGNNSNSKVDNPTKNFKSATPKKAVKKGGTVSVALESDTPFTGIFLNELSDTSNDSDAMAPANEGLFDTDDTYQINDKGPATLKLDNDNKTATIKIKNGVKWSDGKQVTAKDVEYSYEIIANKATKSSRYTDSLQNIIGMSEYHDGKSNTISGIEDVPFDKLQSSDQVRKKPLFFGPYKMSKVVRGQAVTFVPNKYYWRGTPKLDKVTIQVLNPNSASQAIKSHKYDIAGVINTQWKNVANTDNVNWIAKIPLSYRYLGFKVGKWDAAKGENVMDKNAKMNNKALRQAIAYGMNISAVNKRYTNGLTFHIPTLIPAQFGKYFDKNVKGYDYNIKKGNEILDKAGYKKKGKYRVQPNGKPLTIHFAAMSGDSTQEPIIQNYIQQWKKLGLNVKLTGGRLMEMNSFYDKVQNDSKDVDMFMGAWSLSSEPSPNDLYSAKAPYNFSRFVTAKNTKLLQEMDSQKAFNTNYRVKKFHEWQKYMDDEAYVVPVSNSYSIDAVNSKITGYSSKPSAANSLWYNVGIAK